MLSNRQQAYLDAMDIGVWNLREPVLPVSNAAVNLAQLKLGPGSGGILLVCAADTDSASRLANDINRVLGGAPVWAWPFDGTDAVDLGNAVAENLFTTVAFFGGELASRFFTGEPPAHLNSANIVLLPSMQDIQSKAGARRALWDSFCRSGMVDQG
ncbi:MAG TPA: DNA polymerase III subunit psi [Xanthomonadales bacterium]